MTDTTSEVVAETIAELCELAAIHGDPTNEAVLAAAALIWSLVARDEQRLAHIQKLEKRIHNQRQNARDNWEIVEMRNKWLGTKASRDGYIRAHHRAKKADEARVEAERLLAEARGQMNVAHRLATAARDRRSTAKAPAPEDIQAVVEATRPLPVATLSAGGGNG